MNWDWEKLQEKRQRQGNAPRPKGDEPGGNPLGNFDAGSFFSKFTNNGLPIIPIVIVLSAIWLASGFFIVKPGEIGVITTFGKFSREVGDGPHYHLPYPIEQRATVEAERLRTIIIGQTVEGSKTTQTYKRGMNSSNPAEEASMFTGDENIVHMRFNVQYHISNPKDFLFSVRDPGNTVKLAAEAAMREVVGRSNIDSILTTGRSEVQAQALEVLRNILAPYEMGVQIHTVQLLDVQPPAEVEAAFKDVASAREDKERISNEAEAYRMEIVPVATGTAQGMINAAEAYSRQVVQAAEGEAQRFLAMVAEYEKAKDITKKRMYLEAMNDVLSTPGMKKFVLSKDSKGAVLPLLNLDPSWSGARALPQSGGGAR